MELKTTILIILNLALIESLLSFSIAMPYGAMLSEVPQQSRIKFFYSTAIAIFVLKCLVLLFASYIIRFSPLYGGVLFFVLFFIFVFKKNKVKENFKFPMALTVFVSLFLIEKGPSIESVHPAVAFTDNIFIILIGIVIGILSFIGIVYWSMRLAIKMPFYRYSCYIFLILLVCYKVFFLLFFAEFYGENEIVELVIGLVPIVLIIFATIYYRLKLK